MYEVRKSAETTSDCKSQTSATTKAGEVYAALLYVCSTSVHMTCAAALVRFGFPDTRYFARVPRTREFVWTWTFIYLFIYFNPSIFFFHVGELPSCGRILFSPSAADPNLCICLSSPSRFRRRGLAPMPHIQFTVFGFFFHVKYSHESQSAVFM